MSLSVRWRYIQYFNVAAPFFVQISRLLLWTILPTTKHPQSSKFLDITLYFTFSWDEFFGPLSLPSLETFNSFGFPSPNFSEAVTALLVCSKCSLLNIYLDHDAEGEDEPPHPEIMQLLQETPNLKSFTTGYIAPPALIRAVHGELLPRLIDVDWTIRPEGLRALLDLPDAHVVQSSLFPHFNGVIRAACLGGRGFAAARGRYCENHLTYKTASVDIAVENFEGHDLCSSEGNDSDSE